jgi:predicted enzyme related to lactoylglutathione lyase
MATRKKRSKARPAALVTGFGGLFFRSKDPKRLSAWYADRLGLAIEPWGGCVFQWREKRAPKTVGYTVWSPFAKDTKYFAPSRKDFMFNLRVADLDRVLLTLRRRGVTVDDKVEDSEFGRFGWCMDPEGHRIELWQPPKAKRAAPKRKKKPAARAKARPARKAPRRRTR